MPTNSKKIINPKTVKFVKRDGTVGRKIKKPVDVKSVRPYKCKDD